MKQGYALKIKTYKALYPLQGFTFEDRDKAVEARDSLRQALEAAGFKNKVSTHIEMVIINPAEEIKQPVIRSEGLFEKDFNKSLR